MNSVILAFIFKPHLFFVTENIGIETEKLSYQDWQLNATVVIFPQQ